MLYSARKMDARNSGCIAHESAKARSRQRRSEWWGKYTMTMSAALDSGLAFALVVVFFGFVYPGWGWVQNLKWWGTEVYKQGCDWQACAYLGLQPGEKFGP